MNERSLGLILVGAGSSRRMHGVDKIWEILTEQPERREILWYSLQRLAPEATATVLVVREEHLSRAREFIAGRSGIQVVAGGEERQESVRRGLDALPSVDIVAVHDVARPFASPSLLREGASLVEPGAGAIPVLPLSDTVKSVNVSGTVSKTIDRSALRAVQTPQLFWGETLRTVHAYAATSNRPSTDDALLFELAGCEVRTFPGATENFKITHPFDLDVARLLVSHQVIE